MSKLEACGPWEREKGEERDWEESGEKYIDP